MTEIRHSPSCGGGVGLFATRDFKVGDVILQEDTPLIRLAPTSRQQEQRLIDQYLLPFASRKPYGSMSLWDCLASPDPSIQVPPEMNGKFRGMIQAVLCYVYYLEHQQKQELPPKQPKHQMQQKQKKHRTSNNDDDDNDKMDETTKKLLDLYHPHNDDGDDDDSVSNYNAAFEQELLLVVDQAFQFLGHIIMLTTTSEPTTEFLSSLLDSCPNRLRRIMTIWSCNAFEGGRIYQTSSRLNHSCNPNAMFFFTNTTSTTASATTNSSNTKQQKEKEEEEETPQILKAVCDIRTGEEITISYLHLPFLYAETRTRQEQLRWTKHMKCHCDRCNSFSGVGPNTAPSAITIKDDTPGALPCPTCHPRMAQKQLTEDVQYDDDGNVVHYIYPPQFHCSHCQTTTTTTTTAHAAILKLARTISDQITWYLQDMYHVRPSQKIIINQAKQRKPMKLPIVADVPTAASNKKADKTGDDDDDEENDDDDDSDEILEQQLSLASTVLGARHWTTNLLLFLYTERKLQAMHVQQLTQGGQPPEEGELAECIDALQRITPFVRRVDLKLNIGHLMYPIHIAVARTLVSLGDVKSQKYAAEWLKDIQDYVQIFEDEHVQKVVAALSVAWQRHNDDDDDDDDDDRPETKKRQKT